MKRRLLILVVGATLAIVVAPAWGAIGPTSSPYVTDPVITSASYDSTTQVLSLTWTLVSATNGGSNLQLAGQNLGVSASPSTTSGVLTHPTHLWTSDDQTRLNTSLLVDLTNPLTPGTYYLQIEDLGTILYCLIGPCPPNPLSSSTFNNNSPVASFMAAARPPPPPPPPPPPSSVRCVVPKVVGKSLTTARRRLLASHCRTGRVGYGHSRVRRGLVYWQSRRPSARLARGSRVGLLVSLGR